MVTLSNNNNGELWDGRELHVGKGGCKDDNRTFNAYRKIEKTYP